jgi:hypothetical protein
MQMSAHRLTLNLKVLHYHNYYYSVALCIRRIYQNLQMSFHLENLVAVVAVMN